MADNIDLKGAPWTESEDEVLSRLARTCERIGASIDHFFHSPRLETGRNAHPRDGCIVGTLELCLPR